MRILIFGATGRTGRELVAQSLERGHQVTAFVRSPNKLTLCDGRLQLAHGASLGVGETRGQLGPVYNWLLWTIVQPAALTNGPRTGKYRVGKGASVGRLFPRISRADVAHFMLEELVRRARVREAVPLRY